MKDREFMKNKDMKNKDLERGIGMPAEVSMEIQTWPIDKLVFYARNPRKNDAAVDRMCGSIREFGFKIPCLVRSDGEVIDGHLRLKAARKLGIQEIPIILCDEWTPAQVKAFRLMVNRSPELTTGLPTSPAGTSERRMLPGMERRARTQRSGLRHRRSSSWAARRRRSSITLPRSRSS
jgi:ParB-like nuclease domain